MDLQDISLGVVLVTLYVFTSVFFCITGDIIVGRKIKKPADIFYPFSKEFGSDFGSKNRPAALYFLYYGAFIGALALITLLAMSFRNSFRDWVGKLMGAEDSGAHAVVTPTPSQTSGSENSGVSKTESNSDTILNKSTKSIKKKRKPKKPEYKPKVPNVMRSSVVDPSKQVIPPVPRLSMKEDTPEKLSRVMEKLSGDLFEPFDDSDDQEAKNTPQQIKKKK